MYDDYAFGPGSKRWGDADVVPTVDTHSSYHAGEINHIRSLLQRSDGWMWGLTAIRKSG